MMETHNFGKMLKTMKLTEWLTRLEELSDGQLELLAAEVRRTCMTRAQHAALGAEVFKRMQVRAKLADLSTEEILDELRRRGINLCDEGEGEEWKVGK